MEKQDKVIRAGEAKAKLKEFRIWFDGPVQTPQDKLAKKVIEMCIEIIDKLKPVEAEPVVHAHWNGDCCSRCGELAEENYPRCPYCGAHMDEEVADGN